MRLEASGWKARHIFVTATAFALLMAGMAIVSTTQAGAQSMAQSEAPTMSPTTPDGYFPLKDVRRGLHAVAYTVFEGTQPEAMQVEILGVLRNALGPNRDMILARLQGSKPEYTGVVAGMSGSPVYIDGKLLGALSYRIGQFSKEAIAGITPIEQMIAVRDIKTAPAGMEMASVTKGDDAQDAAGLTIRPIETPLSLSGFSPEALKPFRERLAAVGLTAMDGVGGGAPDIKQPEPLVPGSAVSALLVTGDLEMAATCTVTYVDTKHLLACGHPITQSGAVSMPMTKAEVVATLASPLNAFKIINTTELAGAFDQDRASAISGTLGEKATLIPVTLSVTEKDQPEKTLHFGVIDDPQMTPLLLLLSTYQALLQNNQYGAEMSYRLRGEIMTDTGQKVNIDSFEAPTDLIPSAIAAALSLGDRFTRVYTNRARMLKIESVVLHIEETPGNRGLEIESAATTQPFAHAGQTVMIDAMVRPYQQAARHVEVPVKLPSSLPAGPLRVVLSGATELDRILQAPSPFAQGGLDENAVISQLNAAHVNDALYATILTPGAQAIVDGKTLGSLPLSMVNAMEPMHASHKMTLNGESAVLAATLPLDGMVTGQQVVTIEVE
jgi:hypothetical protein